jgi:hypothetical protein
MQPPRAAGIFLCDRLSHDRDPDGQAGRRRKHGRYEKYEPRISEKTLQGIANNSLDCIG